MKGIADKWATAQSTAVKKKKMCSSLFYCSTNRRFPEITGEDNLSVFVLRESEVPWCFFSSFFSFCLRVSIILPLCSLYPQQKRAYSALHPQAWTYGYSSMPVGTYRVQYLGFPKIVYYQFSTPRNVLLWVHLKQKTNKNYVKRLAIPNRAVCLMWSANEICEAFYRAEYICSAYRGLSGNGEEKTCFSLGRSAES